MNNITFITWHHVINRIQFGCNNRKMHHFSLQLFGNVLENVQAKVDCDQIRKKKKNEQIKTRFCHFYGISYSFEGGWLNMASSFAYNSFMHTMNFAREWVINVMAIAIYNSFQLFNSTQNVHFVADELQWQKNHLNYWNFGRKYNDLCGLFGILEYSNNFHTHCCDKLWHFVRIFFSFVYCASIKNLLLLFSLFLSTNCPSNVGTKIYWSHIKITNWWRKQNFAIPYIGNPMRGFFVRDLFLTL